MPKEFDKRGEITEEAIPAAILVKTEILDVRTRSIETLADYVYRQKRGQDTNKELNKFHGNVVALYQLLREKFKNSEKVTIKEDNNTIVQNFKDLMDELITTEKKLNITSLYRCFCLMNKKIEDLKITKIERRKIPEEEALA